MKKEITWACCDNCGSDCITAETTASGPDYVHDGDELTCEECGEKGWVSGDEENQAVDYWHCSETLNEE